MNSTLKKNDTRRYEVQGQWTITRRFERMFRTDDIMDARMEKRRLENLGMSEHKVFRIKDRTTGKAVVL